MIEPHMPFHGCDDELGMESADDARALVVTAIEEELNPIDHRFLVDTVFGPTLVIEQEIDLVIGCGLDRLQRIPMTDRLDGEVELFGAECADEVGAILCEIDQIQAVACLETAHKGEGILRREPCEGLLGLPTIRSSQVQECIALMHERRAGLLWGGLRDLFLLGWMVVAVSSQAIPP
jgi:hypothetical protein